MIGYVTRRLAMRNLPRDLTLVEIDRADASVWRFDERQSLNGQATASILGGGRRWSAIGSGISSSTSAGAGTAGPVAPDPGQIPGQFSIARPQAQPPHPA